MKKLFYLLFFILLLFLLTYSIKTTFFVKEDYKILFVLYDAGETHAMIPLMERLDINKINYKALVMSTGRNLIENQKRIIDINSTCGVEPFLDREKWKKEDALSEKEIEKVKNCVDAKVVITGMASKIQHQITLALKSKGIDVIGYYDSFTFPIEEKIPLMFLNDLNELWVPTEVIKNKFIEKKSDLKIEVVGQPIISKWIATVDNTDKNLLKKKLLIDNNLPTILYAGGHGEQYQESFELFVNSAKKFANKYNTIISLHPKVDGNFEKQILLKNKISNITIIPKDITTMEATAAADVIVCHRSTVGISAFLAHKPVIYLDVAGSSYTNFIIENAWAPQVNNEFDFVKAIQQKLRLDNVEISTDEVYQKVGMPIDSVGLMFEKLSNKI